MRNINVGWLLLTLAVVMAIGLSGLYLNQRAEHNSEIETLHQIIEELRQPKPEPPTPNTHADAITQIEKQAGTPLSRIATLIIQNEGDRSMPYPDPTNQPTIGVGRNLKGKGLSISEIEAITDEIDYKLLIQKTQIQNGRIHIPTLDLANQIFTRPLTKDDVQLLLADDLKSAQVDAVSVFGTQQWQKISQPRREALLDVVFNLGLPRFKQFQKMIDAIKKNDWDTASRELLLSEAAKENPARYFRNYRVLRDNDPTAFQQ